MIVPKIINKDKIIKLKITSSFPDVVLANLQEKSVVPTREIQEVVADETYDGLSKVTIEPIPSEYVSPYEYFNEEIYSKWYDSVKKMPPLKLNSTTTNCANMFANCTASELDLSEFDTSNVTNMNSMFYKCSIKTLDLSNFNTSKVTSMRSMFEQSRVTTVIAKNFDLTNVSEIAYLFYEAYSVTEIDLSNWTNTKIKSMFQAFTYCQNLKRLDMRNFDTSKVTEMHLLFMGCKSLEYLDIRKFDFTNVTSSSGVFSDVPANCLIIVKDDTARNWIIARASWLNNIKTIAEL